MAMRGYDNRRDELRDYDDYYEDDEGQEYEEEGEEEYEEEERKEPRKPTKEELEYLELRQKLKEPFRKKIQKENSGSGTSRADSTDHRKRNKLPYDNYGSFFGPSQPVIASRVIQESKSLLESPHLAHRTSKPHHIKKNENKVSNGGSKSISHNRPPKVSEVKVKAQKLKDTRDYSFLLSDDVELPVPSKAPPIRNGIFADIEEGRPAHAPRRSKQPLSNGGKLVHDHHEERKQGSVASHLPPKSGSNYNGRQEERKQGSVASHLPPRSGSNYYGASHLPPKSGSNYNGRHEERKQGSVASHLPPRSGSNYNGRHEERKQGSVANHLPPKSGSNYRLSSTSKPSMTSADSRKQLSNNSGNGPGWPLGPKVPSKMSVGTTGNKSSTPGIRNPVKGVQKLVPSKVHSSIPRQSVDKRKDIREPYKPKTIPKLPVATSKPQINKPAIQNPMNIGSREHHPKNKVVRRHPDDAEDEMDISRMIRSMFNYNPNKFADDDDDDDNMEAGFDEILREERRSAIIAQREDEEQLRLIEEEEERERRRRMAKSKKRRLE